MLTTWSAGLSDDLPTKLSVTFYRFCLCEGWTEHRVQRRAKASSYRGTRMQESHRSPANAGQSPRRLDNQARFSETEICRTEAHELFRLETWPKTSAKASSPSSSLPARGLRARNSDFSAIPLELHEPLFE